jgi:pimeloyl-ACP methyl ester carboxylesterase
LTVAADHTVITFDADRLSVTAHSWGARDAPLALLLHGYPDTAWTWRHLGPALANAGYRVVAPYLRGYAPTALAPDGGYSPEALVGDTLATCEALGADGDTVLVGHDWGAETAYAAGAVAPQSFRRIVTLAVPPAAVFGELWRHPLLLLRQAKRFDYIALNQLPGTERLLHRQVPRLWRRWSPAYGPDEDVWRALAALRSPERRTAALRYYRAIALQPRARGGGHPRVVSIPRGVGDVPIRYLHGERDGCILADVARLAARHVPTRILPGAGHFLQLEAPDVVSAEVLGFLGPV